MRIVQSSVCRGWGGCIPPCTGQGVYPRMHWGLYVRGCLSGVCVLGGVCPGGVCQGGVYPWGVCQGVSTWGVSAQGVGGVYQGCLPGVCLPEWVSAQGGVCPPPRRQNDRCLWKYYLAATTLRTVNIIVQLNALQYQYLSISVQHVWKMTQIFKSVDRPCGVYCLYHSWLRR